MSNKENGAMIARLCRNKLRIVATMVVLIMTLTCIVSSVAASAQENDNQTAEATNFSELVNSEEQFTSNVNSEEQSTSYASKAFFDEQVKKIKEETLDQLRKKKLSETMLTTAPANTTTTTSSTTTTALATTTTTSATSAPQPVTTIAEVIEIETESEYVEESVTANDTYYSDETSDSAYYDETVSEATEDYYYEEPVVETNTYSTYVSDSDYILLCNVVANEAGSSWISTTEKAKVVDVVMNRVYSSSYPNTIYGVLTQNGQFSGCWNYVNLGTYSGYVTEDVKNAVTNYLSGCYGCYGYYSFYGDGYQNYFY